MQLENVAFKNVLLILLAFHVLEFTVGLTSIENHLWTTINIKYNSFTKRESGSAILEPAKNTKFV